MKNFLLLVLLFLSGFAKRKNEKIKTYRSGFKIIHAIDKSRIYKPNTGTTDYLHFRPLDIDIWYPASPSATDTTLVFRNLLALLDERANYYTASNAGNGLSQQIAQLFCNGFKCSDSTKLLNFKTKSFKDAPSVKDKFPLIIYLSAFNGMSYENFTLFEDLASKGFVVASISSIGRFPGDMTMKKEDLMEQVNDAITSVNTLKASSNIDFSTIGIIGYSWGGLAGSILAAKIFNTACLVSLDGSEFHHYGQSKEENNYFDSIRYSQDFKNMRLSMPYLRLESTQISNNEKEDSVYNFLEKLSNGKQVYKVDSAQHEDFGCMSLVVREAGNCRNNHRFSTIEKIAIDFLEEHLKSKNSF